MQKLFNYTIKFSGRVTITASTEEEALDKLYNRIDDLTDTEVQDIEEFDPLVDDYCEV